ERRIESALRRGVVARGVEGEGLEEWPPDGVGRGPAERTCRGYGLLGPLVLDQVAEQRPGRRELAGECGEGQSQGVDGVLARTDDSPGILPHPFRRPAPIIHQAEAPEDLIT